MTEDKKDENIISSNENEENIEKKDDQPGVDENLSNSPNEIANESQNISQNQENEAKTNNESQRKTMKHYEKMIKRQWG